MSYMKYLARFVSDSSSKHLEDRDRYEVMVKIDPWDKVEEFECECKGYLYGRKNGYCRHVKELFVLLKEWKEIQEIPEFEVKNEDAIKNGN